MASEAGKGGDRRPMQVTHKQYSNNFQAIVWGRKWECRDLDGKVLKTGKSFEECETWRDANVPCGQKVSIVEV